MKGHVPNKRCSCSPPNRKKTPKKAGCFTVVWEKNTENNNEAFSAKESPDWLLILIIDDNRTGVFLFPKRKLVEQGILKQGECPGKMGFRVYPSWESKLNSTATKTQLWQAPYFMDMNHEGSLFRIEELLKSKNELPRY